MALPTHKGIMLAGMTSCIWVPGGPVLILSLERGVGGGAEHSGFVLIMFIKSPHKALLVSLRESAYRKQGT